MCDVEVYLEYLERLEDYLEYVSTDVGDLMYWEPELYAAYGAYNSLKVEEIREWYGSAEHYFISAGDPDEYIRGQYYHYIRYEDVWDIVDEEIDKGTIYECGGYWFTTE